MSRINTGADVFPLETHVNVSINTSLYLLSGTCAHCKSAAVDQEISNCMICMTGKLVSPFIDVLIYYMWNGSVWKETLEYLKFFELIQILA